MRIMSRRLKRFMSLFFVALLIVPPGWGPTVAKAETNEGDGQKVVYHETFEDGQGIVKQSGDPSLEEVSDKFFDGNDDGVALYVSNRSNDWNGVDLFYNDLELEDEKTYTLTASIYVDEGEDVPSDAQFEIQAVGDDAWGEPSLQNLTAGESVTLNGEFKVDMSTYDRIRIKTNDAGKEVPFYIGEILITGEVTVEEPEEPFEPVVIEEYDFEDGEMQGWQGRGSQVEVVEGPAQSGEYSLLSKGRTDGWNGPSLNLFDDFEIGAEYEVTAYVKRTDLPEDSSQIIMAMIDDSFEGDDQYVWLDNHIIDHDEWVEFSGTHYVRDKDRSELTLYFESNNATEEFYIDNITITMISPPSESGGDDNGDGEQVEIPEDERIAAFTDFEDGTEQGWKPRGDNEELTVTDAEAKNGDNSLLVENRQSSSDAAIIDLFEKVHPGYEYEISLWVKLAPGEEDTPLQLSAAETVNGETSYYPPVIAPTKVTSDEWVLLEGTYNVPKSIEALSFYVEEEYDENSTSGVSYYIDDFKAEVYISETGVQTNLTPLKDIYKDFLIGNAVESVHFSGRTLELLTHHHNLVTAENIMKPEYYYVDGEFNHSRQDQWLQNAVDNNLQIHGHVLLWHSQSEDSLYQNPDGSYKSSEEALANMHKHIENVMRSADEIAGDSIISWDVVNEALDGDWSNPEDWESILRPASGWLQAIGPDYMYEAFLKARQVADDLGRHEMFLYYNDYNDHVQSKAQTMYHMVKDINERYAAEFPDDDRKLISGVGMQGHYTTSVNIENIRTSLERFISLGVEVGVTELDVGASEGTTLTEEEELQQAYFYAQLFSLYKEHSKDISRVTFWGLSDANSWRSESNPLLFDRNLQAKLAYHALVDPEKFVEENGPEEIEPRAGNAAYGTPIIDGEIDEIWSNAPIIPINRFQTAHNGATGESRVLWDDENLYVLVEVNDNELDKSGNDAHEQDSVEVFIDEQNTKAASYGEGHGQYRVNFDNEQSFNPGDISEGFESRTVVSGTNYLVEMKIPFRTVELEAGHTIGFDVQINDAVNGNRNSIAIWNDDYSGMGWSDPSVFGNLTLQGEEDPVDPEDPTDPTDPVDPKDPTDPEDPKQKETVTTKPVVVDKKATVKDSDIEKVAEKGKLVVDLNDSKGSVTVS